MLRRYGLELADWDAMFEQQQGKCAACGEKAKLQIDHDHATGKVRSLLCSDCNTALGRVRESPVRLRLLIAYLEWHRIS